MTENGELFTWGLNDHGQLGIGDKEPRATPTRVPMPADEAPVGTVSCGSTYAAAVTRAGKVLTWGHGGHGNLGHGDRRSRRKPKRVEGALGDEVVVQAACTRGQVGCKGGMSPRQGGAEGPHTCVITATGRLFTFGTCHKGLLYVWALASTCLSPQAPPPLSQTVRAHGRACAAGSRLRALLLLPNHRDWGL